MDDFSMFVISQHGKQHALAIKELIGDSELKYKSLLKLCLSSDKKTHQRAANPLPAIGNRFESIFLSYLPKLLNHAQRHDVHPALSRQVLTLIKDISAPEHLHAIILDFCFKKITDQKFDIAIRSLSMDIVLKLSKNYADLLQELKSTVDFLLPYETSKALINKMTKIKSI